MAQWSLPRHYFLKPLVRYPKLQKRKVHSHIDSFLNVKSIKANCRRMKGWAKSRNRLCHIKLMFTSQEFLAIQFFKQEKYLPFGTIPYYYVLSVGSQEFTYSSLTNGTFSFYGKTTQLKTRPETSSLFIIKSNLSQLDLGLHAKQGCIFRQKQTITDHQNN